MSRGRRSVGRTIGLVILGVIGAAAFALAFGAIVMVLWNWLIPAIFGAQILITYWQAFGLVLLAKLLFGFGSCGGHGGHGGKHKKDKDWECDEDEEPCGPGAYIKAEIRNEFRKEWRKEMEKDKMKDRRKRHGIGKFDNAYEDWWEQEGAKSFEEFMDGRKNGGEEAPEGSEDA